jgi:hypothetical protein
MFRMFIKVYYRKYSGDRGTNVGHLCPIWRKQISQQRIFPPNTLKKEAEYYSDTNESTGRHTTEGYNVQGTDYAAKMKTLTAA